MFDEFVPSLSKACAALVAGSAVFTAKIKKLADQYSGYLIRKRRGGNLFKNPRGFARE